MILSVGLPVDDLSVLPFLPSSFFVAFDTMRNPTGSGAAFLVAMLSMLIPHMREFGVPLARTARQADIGILNASLEPNTSVANSGLVSGSRKRCHGIYSCLEQQQRSGSFHHVVEDQDADSAPAVCWLYAGVRDICKIQEKRVHNDCDHGSSASRSLVFTPEFSS